jgi:asparagine synthase (glutamine-hydrolysing)
MVDEGFGDDMLHARMMADHLKVSLTEIRVKQPTESELRGLAWMLDEPQADPAALYVSAIAEAARADGIKVLLGGVGADDIFSGYRRHRAAVIRSTLGTLRAVMPDSWFSLGVGSQSFRRRLAKIGYLLAGNDDQFLMRAFEFNRQSDAVSCLTVGMAAEIDLAGTGHLEDVMARSSEAPLLDRMLDLELHGFLPDHNLNYTDKASMAHGIEVRVPFLDTRLVAMAQLIPWRLKSRRMQEKWILKRALAQRLPTDILNRKKTGFGAPIRAWLAGGPLRSMVDDVLSSQKFRERGMFDATAVRTLLRDSTAGRLDGFYLVFAIVMIEFWMQQFYDAKETDWRALKVATLSTP